MALALLVAMVAALVSLGAGSMLAIGQRENAEHQLERQATLVTEEVAGEALRYVDTLRTVAAATGAAEHLTATTFADTTRPLADMRLAGAASILYLVPATDADIPQVEALWRSRGAADLQLRPAGAGSEHIFSIFNMPLDGKAAQRTGIDATQSAPATRALGEARRSSRVAVSDPYELLIDQALPAEQRQLSFSLTAPVYGPADLRGRREFRGWVLMGVRGRDFVSAALSRVSQNLVDVTLRAPSDAGTRPVVAVQRASVQGKRDLRREIRVPVADRYWQVEVSAVGLRLPGVRTGLPSVVSGAGIVLGLVLAGLVYVLATGRKRAQAKVEEATAELATAEAAARHQAELLTAILESISDGVGVVNDKGEFLLHNPAAKAILGINEDLDGVDNWQAHYGIFLPDGATAFPTEQLPLVRALAGESTEQVEMVLRNAGHPQGVAISVSGRPLLGGTGHEGAVAVFHDITARKAAKAELAATAAALRAARDDVATQKDYLTQVLDSIDLTVITCDTEGVVVGANRAAHRAFKSRDGEPVHVADAMAAVDLRYPDGRPVPVADSPLLRALQGERVDAMEAVVPRADGTRHIIMIHSRPLRDANGTTIGAVATSYDITDLRERDAELHAFAGVVAHDLKAPLAAVGGYAEILDDDLATGADPATMRGSLDRVRAGVQRMRRLIDDLLAYATTRDAPLRPEKIDLQFLFADVINERTAYLRAGTATGGRPVLFPDIYTGPLPVVRADKVMLRQLVDNLVGNALKYTVPGQPARIDISSYRRSGEKGDVVRVQIADRGIGIPADEQPHVFDTFHRSAAHSGYTGSGLGLAICHRVVQRHGGTIGVADNPGGGTRVWFTLPVDAAPVAPQVRAPERATTEVR